MVSDRIQSSPSKVPKEEYAYARLLELGLCPPSFSDLKELCGDIDTSTFSLVKRFLNFFFLRESSTSPDGPEPNGWISIFQSINMIRPLIRCWRNVPETNKKVKSDNSSQGHQIQEVEWFCSYEVKNSLKKAGSVAWTVLVHNAYKTTLNGIDSSGT